MASDTVHTIMQANFFELRLECENVSSLYVNAGLAPWNLPPPSNLRRNSTDSSASRCELDFYLCFLRTHGLSFILHTQRLWEIAENYRQTDYWNKRFLNVNINIPWVWSLSNTLVRDAEIIEANSRISFRNVWAVLKLNDAFIRFTPLGYKRAFWVQKLVLPLLYKGIPTSNPRSTLVRLKTKGNRPMLADAR